jgi:hypothetical protein
MRALFFIILICLPMMAQESVSRVVKNMSELRALDPVPSKPMVEVLGYYTPGDGGGGTYVLTNTVAGTNAYGGRVLALGGAKSWQLNFANEVSALQFGAIRNDSNSDNAEVQAAIDFAESQASIPEVSFPPGDYWLSGVTVKKASLRGYGGGRDQSASVTTPNVAKIYHLVGSTNDMITVAPTSNPSPGIRGFELVGRRQQNLKNPFTISSVTSRTNFTVSNPGSLPPAPSSPTTFPYYGYCFFFSSENKYIGAGLVVGMNTGTGVINLYPGSDWYATATNASYLLSTGYKVCFSSDATESASFKTTTGRDSTTAGYSGINVKATSAGFLVSDVALEDLYVRRFHTGIRLGNVLITKVNRVRGNTCTFATIASAFPGDTRDGLYSQDYFQGFWSDEPGMQSETITFDNNIYRRTLFGWYGVESSGNVEAVTADHCGIGFLFKDCLETRVGTMLVDNPGIAGVVLAGGITSGDRPQIEIGEIQIRNGNEASMVPTTSNPFYAISSAAVNSTAYIHGLSVVQFGTDRFFTSCFNFPFTTQCDVGFLWSFDGATSRTLNSGTMASYPKIAHARIDGNQWKSYSQGNEVLSVTGTGISSPVALTLSGAYDLSVAAGKTLIKGNGYNGIDSIGVGFVFGADESNGAARTDSQNKAMRLYAPNYLNASPQITSLYQSAQSGTSILYLGGGIPDKETATEIRLFTGPKGGLNGTNHFFVTTAGSVVAANRFKLGSDTGPSINYGTGSPEGVLSAPIGSLYFRTDGGTGSSVYQKDIGTGNTGWRPIAPVRNSASVSFSSISANSSATATITVTGASAASGQVVVANPQTALTAGLLHTGTFISGANTVTITLYNPTAGSLGTTNTWDAAVFR